MSSYNYIGVTYAGAKPELLNNILRDEWGFEGFVLTDYDGNFGYMDSDQIIRNGGAACLATYDVGSNYMDDKSSATSVQAMRKASKDIMFTIVNSRAYASENIQTGMQTWEMLGIVIDMVLAVMFILLEVITVKKILRRKQPVIISGEELE